MSNPDCKFAISAAYTTTGKDPGSLTQELIVAGLTLITFVLGIYTFCSVIVRHRLYKTKLLCAYYVFTFGLLVFRLITFFILIVS